jgi:beta-galactosidase
MMKKKTVLVPALLITVLIAASITVASARTKTSLNMGWKFTRSDVADARASVFNDSSWQRISLPHTWNVEDPWDDEPGYYRGVGWYRRDLIIPSGLNRCYFLYFEGANQVADVFVNGERAGSHIGGYSAFAFDVTRLVRPGRNVIAVRVDNKFDEDVPPLTADFNFYGGIYRDVWLIATNNVHLTVTDHASPGVRITTPDIAKGTGTVAIKGTVVNASGGVTVVSTIVDATGRKVAEATSPISSDRFTQSAVVPRPKLWSPDSPYLYTVRISVRRGRTILDQIAQPLGFRWFEFTGAKGFSLNGTPLKLRGTNRHQDYLGMGNALPDRLHVRDMEIIKNAGFNFVRLAHYPQDPSVLEACDRLGLLIWEETPIVNYITKSATFAENSVLMVREMIRQHRNHPSMLLWGYMNEIFLRVPQGRDDLYPATVELARELNRIAKEEDPTRPTTIAFHGNDVYNRTGLGDVADVIGWNLYQGWYSQTVTDFGKFLDEQHRRFPNRPLIVSEYGANGDRRLSSADPRRFDSTIDYHRFFHESYLAQIDARPYLAGSAIWNQFDFGAELRGETIPHLNQKGMYTFDRRPKDIHYLYKASLSKDPVVHIAVRDNQRRAGPPGEKHRVDVYTNMSTVELFHNGKGLGTRSVDASRKVSWDVELKHGTNPLVARGTRGKSGVTDSIIVTFAAVTVNSPEIAINVGSNADFTDERGVIWLADKPYEFGSWGFVGNDAKRIYSRPPDPNILGTLSDPLFQTQVEGLRGYRVDVPDGAYAVELLFAERTFEDPGKRIFNVAINGKRVLDRLDLAAATGRNRAFMKRVDSEVRGGLTVTFEAVVGEPVLSGILVRRK